MIARVQSRCFRFQLLLIARMGRPKGTVYFHVLELDLKKVLVKIRKVGTNEILHTSIDVIWSNFVFHLITRCNLS